MPLDGGTSIFNSAPTDLPTGSLEDLVDLQPGQSVSITNTQGESIIGQPISNETLWQQWNITITSDTTTTSNVIQVRPESITTNASGEATIVWRQWNNDLTTSATATINPAPSITTSTSITGSAIAANTSSLTFTGDSSASSVQIWSAWNRPTPHVWRQMSQEDRERHERHEREYAERRAREEAEKAEANEKAEKLLLSCLSAEQKMQWRTRKCFYVTSRAGRRYRFDSNSYQGNVKLVDQNDVVLSSFCIHLRYDIPLCDHLLAQKLMLEADEPTFMRIANETRRAGSERVSDLILAAA